MFSESGGPIAPNGSAPIWRFHDRVRPGPAATWLSADLREMTARVLSVTWESAGYWRYRVRFSDSVGTTTFMVEAELVCARHNERGSTGHAGRKIQIHCTCGQLVRTDYQD